jgi:hypothetical protein
MLFIGLSIISLLFSGLNSRALTRPAVQRGFDRPHFGFHHNWKSQIDLSFLFLPQVKSQPWSLYCSCIATTILIPSTYSAFGLSHLLPIITILTFYQPPDRSFHFGLLPSIFDRALERDFRTGKKGTLDISHHHHSNPFPCSCQLSSSCNCAFLAESVFPQSIDRWRRETRRWPRCPLFRASA